MMSTAQHEIYQALADGRDNLSDRFDEMRDSRDFWRGGFLIMAGLAALEILRQWAGWSPWS